MSVTRGQHALRGGLVATTILLLANLATPPLKSYAAATTFNVTTITDSNDGACTASLCSLRDAVVAANASSGPNTIRLPAGTYTLSLGSLNLGTSANLNTTITGAGAASTIINGDGAHSVFITGLVSNLVTTFQDLTIVHGFAPNYDFGGGAIQAGGFSGDALTVTNCAFRNNSNASASGGGAIVFTGSGTESLTITGSTFDSNTSTNGNSFTRAGDVAYGGAIVYGGNQLSISNSTFTNNHAGTSEATTPPGQGGALDIVNPNSSATASVTNSTFTGNIAYNGTDAGIATAAIGGAIYVSAGATTIQYNRIVNNTADTTSSAAGSSSGMYAFMSPGTGTLNATDNWWGINTNPIGALLDGSPTPTLSSWIVLKTTASPNPIQEGQSTTLTTSFLQDSNGGSLTASQISTLLDLGVNWANAAHGTLSNQQTSIQSSGTATATLTQDGTCNNASGEAKVDTVPNGDSTATGTVTVDCPVGGTTTTTVTSSANPSAYGQSVSFTATVSSLTGTPSGSVQFKVDGATFGSAAALVNGQATSGSTSGLSVGPHTVTAFYTSDSSDFLNSDNTASPLTQTVNKDDTTTTLSSIASPQNYGDTITFTAAVSVDSPGAGMPTGMVSFYDNGNPTPIGTGSLNGADPDQASFSTSVLAVGNHTITASYGGDGTDNASGSNSVSFVVQVPTSTLYMGMQILNIGTTLSVSAQVSSSPAVAVCTNNTSTVSPAPAPYVTFSLDSNPLTGAAGSYAVASNVPVKSGTASLSGITTTSWLEGVYTLSATYTGPTGCVSSFDTATLTVASPGDAANGGGWYNLSGSGRINFGFVVQKIPNTSPTPYKGQLNLINNGKWRLKGNLTSYSKTSTGQGAASGTGNLYWWNQSLNGGLGDWQAVAFNPVSFTISFTATGSNAKTSPGSFGIHISYTPVPPQPSSLPNSSPQPLKGGDIKVT